MNALVLVSIDQALRYIAAGMRIGGDNCAVKWERANGTATICIGDRYLRLRKSYAGGDYGHLRESSGTGKGQSKQAEEPQR